MLSVVSYGFLLYGFGFAGAAYAAIPQSQYDAVIASARDGNTALAIAQLKQWHAQEPDNKRVLYDLVVVLQWAGDSAAVLQLSDELLNAQTPPYVLKSIGHAFLATERWTDAERAFRMALDSDPRQIDARANVVRVMLASHREDDALRYVQSFLPAFSSGYSKDDLPMLMLLGQVRSRRGEALLAAATYHEVLRLDPQSLEGLRSYVFALDAAGMPYLAARFADRNRTAFSKDEQRDIKQHIAGRTITFGEAQLAADEKRPRFATTDAALGENAEVLERFGAYPMTLFDRMVALRDRFRMQEVIDLYRSLLAEGINMPSYSLAAVADAYLYLEQPEQARELYLQALALSGKKDVAELHSWSLSLAYAYSEAGQHDEAEALADRLANSTPAVANRGVRALEMPNREFADAALTAAVMRLYSDRLDEAERRLRALRDVAPFNQQARLAWASLQTARSRPRAALQEFTLIAVDDRKSLDARIGMAEQQLTLNQFSDAKAVLPQLLADHPENKGVQGLAREIDIHDRLLLKISTTLGKGTQAAGAESVYDARLYSSPLTGSMGEPYRVFAHVSRASGSAANEDGGDNKRARVRSGMGFDYRIRDFAVEAEVNHAYQNASQSGVLVQAMKEFSDTWRVSFAADSNVNNLSSTAYRADVTARRYGSVLTWEKNESRRIDAEISDTDFSDGNRRTAAALSWTERWHSGPLFKLDSTLAFSASHNSATNAVYFNPASDREANLTVTGDWMTWRHYRRSFRQQVQVFGGRYWQRGFDDAALSGAQYSHEWNVDEDFSIQYGYGITTHPYDGVREKRHYAYLNLTWAIK